MQKFREEVGMDGVKVLQGQGRGAQGLQAEEVLMEEGIFMFLSVAC